jgi:hypothetical protein
MPGNGLRKTQEAERHLASAIRTLFVKEQACMAETEKRKETGARVTSGAGFSS